MALRRRSASGDGESPSAEDLDREIAELREAVGEAFYTCPACEERTDEQLWKETQTEKLDPTLIGDEAYFERIYNSALLTCPRCGHTETRKDLDGYLEFAHNRSWWWHERAIHRLVIGRHHNPTWNRRLVLTLVMTGLGLGGVVWWAVSPESFERTWEAQGSYEVLLACSVFFAVIGPVMVFRTLREVLGGRGHRRSRG